MNKAMSLKFNKRYVLRNNKLLLIIIKLNQI